MGNSDHSPRANSQISTSHTYGAKPDPSGTSVATILVQSCLNSEASRRRAGRMMSGQVSPPCPCSPNMATGDISSLIYIRFRDR